MAKKTIGKDNTTPPTNYIGMRTDASGNVVGIYEYANGSGVKIAAGRGVSSSNGTVITNNGSVVYYTTMEQGAEEASLSGIVCRDENGIAQVAALPEDMSQGRNEDVVNVSTMQTYIDDVMDNVATDVVESDHFNKMVTEIIKDSDISISTDPLGINVQ